MEYVYALDRRVAERLAYEIQVDEWDGWVRQAEAIEQGVLRGVAPFASKDARIDKLPMWKDILAEYEVPPEMKPVLDKFQQMFNLKPNG